MLSNGTIAVAHIGECGNMGRNATLADLINFLPYSFQIVQQAHIVAIYDASVLRLVKNRYCNKMNELPYEELNKVHALTRLNDQALLLR